MNDEQKSLAQKLVQWPGWEWGKPTAGVRVWTTHSGGYPEDPAGSWFRVDYRHELEDAIAEEKFGPCGSDEEYDALWLAPLPDLTDAATKGAILGRLRAVRDDPFVSCMRASAGWAVWAFPLGDAFKSTRIALEDTEEGALVAACLATRMEELT